MRYINKCIIDLGYLVTIALLSMYLFSLSGCATGVSTELPIDPMGRNFFSCNSFFDKITYKRADMLIGVNPPKPGCSQMSEFYRIGQSLYCDHPFKASDTNFDALVSEQMIQLPYEDNNDASKEYVQVNVFYSKPEAVYVAFDERALTPPDWLRLQFQPASGDQGQYYITTTIMDKSTKKNVKLLVWRKNKPLFEPGSTVISFGGNSGDGVNWGNVPVDNRAMYVIFVKSSNVEDTSKPHIQITLGHKAQCWPNQSMAEKKASEEISGLAPEVGPFPEGANPPFILTGTTCEPVMECPAETAIGSYMGNLSSYLQHSRVVFNPWISNAHIEVLGKTYNQPASGILDFEFDEQEEEPMSVLQVNGIIIEAGDIDEFKDIVLVLTKPFEAKCGDSLTKILTPCDTYKIMANTMFAIVGATYKGKQLLSLAEHPQPLTVTINHTTRAFRLQTPPGTSVKAAVKVDGETKPIKMNLDITGTFENLQPVPQTVESKTSSECVEGSNSKLLTLDARGSYDIYSNVPLNYLWYQNFGLTTEKILGNTTTLPIWPGTLSYGKYPVTLCIKDGYGGVSFDNLDLIVEDTKPPLLKPPPDFYAFSMGGTQKKLDIGIPYTTDSCSGSVRKMNDAPPNNQFSCGETVVTWQADDYNGNIVEKKQRIKVFCVQKHFDLSKALSFIEEALLQTKMELLDCDGGFFCRIDIKNLKVLIETFGKLLQERKGERREFMEMGNELLKMASKTEELDRIFDNATSVPEIRLRRIQQNLIVSQIEELGERIRALKHR